MEMTPQLAREIWEYDEYTGKLYWKVPSHNNNAGKGKEAGSVRWNGSIYFMTVGYKGKRFPIANIIWMIVYGVTPRDIIDHIDRDQTNNLTSNLREATSQQNSFNRRDRTDNTTGYQGVVVFRGKFRAAITHNRKFIYIGVYETAEEAYEAYKQKAKE